MKKFYYYLYYRIYHFSIKVSDDVLNEIKPGATIIILELLLITQFFIWLQLFKILSKSDQDLLWSKPILVVILLLLIVFNYFVFLYRDKREKYDKEFKNYIQKKKHLWDSMVIIVITAVLFGFVSAFYIFYNNP